MKPTVNRGFIDGEVLCVNIAIGSAKLLYTATNKITAVPECLLFSAVMSGVVHDHRGSEVLDIHRGCGVVHAYRGSGVACSLCCAFIRSAVAV